MAIEFNKALSELQKSLPLSLNTVETIQVRMLADFYLDLFRSSDFLSLAQQGQLRRLGVVLVGPSAIEIAGIQMAMAAVGVQPTFVGIEKEQ